jgi:hypothetical protein
MMQGQADFAGGLGETMYHMARAAIAQPFAGWSGLLGVGAKGMGLEADPAAMVEKTTQFIAGSPKSESGQRISEDIGKAFELVDNKIKDFSYALGDDQDVLGATATYTAIMALPTLLGIKETAPSKAMSLKAVKTLDRVAKEMGVDIGSAEFPEQIAKAADQRVGISRGDYVKNTQAALMEAKKKASDAADLAFEIARNPAKAKLKQFGLKSEISTGADIGADDVQPGLTVRLKDKDNNTGGFLTAVNRKVYKGDQIVGEGVQVKSSRILDEDLRRKGLGIEMYQDAIDAAVKEGKMEFTSDASLTPDSQGVWESLKRRGYTVERLPENQIHEVRDVVNGELMGLQSKNGQPIYRLKLDENAQRMLENRNLPASVRAKSLPELQLRMVKALKSYNTKRMPDVQDLLEELDVMGRDTLGRSSPNKKISLEQLDDYRRRIRNSRTRNGEQPQDAALTIMKGQLDEFVDDMFREDMIVGNPANIEQWKNARSLYTDYRRRFKDYKVIRQMTEHEASAEDWRKFIFGLNRTGAKTEAAVTVKRLNEILGKDSDAMQSLRHEFILDVVQPLLEKEPNFQKFISNYEKIVRENPTLVDELAPFSRTDLDKLYQLGKAYDNLGGIEKVSIDWTKTLARLVMGHKIAKAAIKVTLFDKLLRFGRNRLGGNFKRAMIREMLGYDPYKPFIGKDSLAAQEVIAGELQQRIEDADRNNR